MQVFSIHWLKREVSCPTNIYNETVKSGLCMLTCILHYMFSFAPILWCFYSWIYNIHVRTLLSLVVTTGALTRICFSNNYTLILNWAKVKSYQKGGAVKILGMQWLIEVDTHLLWIVNIDIIHVDLKTSSFLSIAPYMYM